ncbi:hypothetical protein HMPREF0653_02671 [Prevotella disiens JCM 6334 = ATCC 29426]|nr:hypothetical protein HMPREF0653_02671 [Prevotella disiens JCM 6334 = ATCC 29426]KXU59276.1 hypothetical protein HMPREF3218_0200619 [Prevotella bivia]
MIPEFYRVKRPYYGIHSSYMFNLKHFIAMKLLKVEAIEDLFAVKGGIGENEPVEQDTTIVVHCNVANSGIIVKHQTAG